MVCPIRYWPLGDNIDQTWRFALNYAHAHGLVPGTEIIFTTGPLGYLCFPQHIRANLGQALTFQAALWLVLALVFGDLFFRGGIRLRNLAFFSVCLGIAAELFWFESMGVENLVLAAALTLLVVYWLRGGVVRYWTALVLIGVLPLIKLSAAITGLTALIGFVIARRSRLDLLRAAVVPGLIAIGLAIATMPSRAALLGYLKGSFEIVDGFSDAMVRHGPAIQIAEAVLAFGLLAAMLSLLKTGYRGVVFYCLLLAMPLFMNFKQGFVRQDLLHVNEFFCFLALAFGLISLDVDLSGRRARRAVLFTGLFIALWLANVESHLRSAAESTGLRGLSMLAGAVPLSHLESHLDAAPFPDESRLEPQIVHEIGNAPVASLSIQFSNLAAAGLQAELYPVVQRYSAYTPYLDGLNAAWIREKGPRFLVFDGDRLDVRHSWAETPALWMEVYRWYDTRLLGPKNLLLERREAARFTGLKTVEHIRTDGSGRFHLLPTTNPIFWKMTCRASFAARLEKTLFRAPIVFMKSHRVNGVIRQDRVIPALLATPVLGNFLPGRLAQYARLFQSDAPGRDLVDWISFEDSTGNAYATNCDVELLSEVD